LAQILQNSHWQLIKSGYFFKVMIPTRPACPEDMRIRPDVDDAIEASSRDDQQFAALL
jgi:metal-sulfur cluster biosynthetic enzyme